MRALGFNPKIVELVLRGRFLWPSVADAEIDTAAGHPVEAGELVGEQDRIAQRGEKYRRAQTHALGARADGGEGGERVDARPGRQAVADPDGMETQCLSALGDSKKTRRVGAPRHDRLAGGKEDAEICL